MKKKELFLIFSSTLILICIIIAIIQTFEIIYFFLHLLCYMPYKDCFIGEAGRINFFK